MTRKELTETSFKVRRTLDAPLDRVFAAFVDPEAIAAWYHPGEMETQVDAWDAEPGGHLDITMIANEEMELGADDPGRYRNVGTFREVVQNERIAHTWRWVPEDDEEEAGESLVEISFREVDGGTEVTLEHTKLPDRETVEDHAAGWIGCLENLARHL